MAPMARNRRREYRSLAWIGMLAVVWVMFGAPVAEARLLNLGGSLSINYNSSITSSKTGSVSSRTTVRSLGQQYTLRMYGDFYLLGSYNLDFSLLNQKVNIQSADQENRYRIQDYRASVHLFPKWLPVNITRQTTVRKTDLEISNLSITTKDRIDTLGANMILNFRRIPRTVLNYRQSELQTDTSTGDFITRATSVFSDVSIGATRLSGGFQHTETKVADSGTGGQKSSSLGYNIDANSQLTSALNVTAAGRYTTNRLGEPALTPGVDFFQEKSFNTSVIYRPPLYWWDGSLSYYYSENPFFQDFRSHSVQSSANLRYNPKTDSQFGVRYLLFKVIDSTVQSQSANASLNYRPVFGLSTQLSGATGLTSSQTTTTQDTDSLFQNYRYGINYTRPWQNIQYRASYNISYGVSDTRPTGFSSRDLGNTINLGLDNTNTRIVHVGFNATYSDIQRITESVKTEQNTYLVQLTADSNYFRNLVFMGDNLGLRAQSNYSETTGFGVEGRITTADVSAAYQTPVGLAMNLSYRIEDHPRELFLDRQLIEAQLHYSTVLFWNLHFQTSLKRALEDNRYRDDLNRSEGNLSVNYQIGEFRIAFQANGIETRTRASRFRTVSYLVTVTRSF